MARRLLRVSAGLAVAPAPGLAGAAAIKVDSLADELNADADCSLREAVEASRLNAEISGCALHRRGFKHPRGKKCDGGSFELGAKKP